MLNRARAVTIVVTAFGLSHCGGTPTAPTAPGSPATVANLPVVRAVTVNRTNVDAGDEVVVTASIDGAWTSGRLRYVWTVQPQGGVMTPDGSTLRWRAPASDPVPATYVFSVSLAEADTTAMGVTSALSSEHSAAMSPPVVVNDARRETMSLAETFLRETADSSVSPQICVRSFADSCQGKQTALQDVTSIRDTYSAASMSYTLQLFVRSVEWANCIAPDGSARCAMLIYDAEWTRTRKTDNVQERVTGRHYVQGFYERNRWWLCGSRFAPE